MNVENNGPKGLESIVCPGNESWWTNEDTFKVFHSKTVAKQAKLKTLDMRFSKLSETQVDAMFDSIKNGDCEEMKQILLYGGNKCTSDKAKKSIFELRAKDIDVNGV